MIVEIGYWINQSFVVRLCALLESHGISLSSDELNNLWC